VTVIEESSGRESPNGRDGSRPQIKVGAMASFADLRRANIVSGTMRTGKISAVSK